MKIALIENFGSDFYGARLRYALFLQEKGHEVIAIVPNDGYVDKISAEGITTIAIEIDIRGRNLNTVSTYASELKSILKKEQFDVIHLYRMQPNLIGSAIAFFYSRDSIIINHITGLGVAFAKTSFKYKMIQQFIKLVYRVNSDVFRAKLIFQNKEDRNEISNSEKNIVVKGSAVNEDKFNLNVFPSTNLKKELLNNYNLENSITLIFVSRLLKQKGLAYLIKAVNLYNETISVEKKIHLIVAGWIDSNNPDSFTESEIEEFKKTQNIIFLGKRDDIDQLIAISDIAVLPTFYREGTPRFLLEAMAMGKSILTTHMPGCSHLVKENENGLLS